MQIVNAIVHLIEKDRHQRPSLQLRNEILPIEANLEGLVGSLRKLYNEKTARGYGVFHVNQIDYPFSVQLAQYLVDRNNFVNFSQVAMRTLETKISNAQLATGGYILFVDYQDNGLDYLIVASIKHRPGLAFDGNLNLTGAVHIELDRLHEMARIDMSAWIDGGERYLSFAKRRSSEDGFSDYFRDFIGCQEISNSTLMNKLLLQAVRAYGSQYQLDVEAMKNVRSVVFNYFEEKRASKETVSLGMLSQRIDEENPERFLNFINEREDDFPITDGFDPVKSIYKQLKTFIFKDRTVKLQFDQEDFGTRVILGENGNILIRDINQDFIAELREFQDNG